MDEIEIAQLEHAFAAQPEQTEVHHQSLSIRKKLALRSLRDVYREERAAGADFLDAATRNENGITIQLGMNHSEETDELYETFQDKILKTKSVIETAPLTYALTEQQVRRLARRVRWTTF